MTTLLTLVSILLSLSLISVVYALLTRASTAPSPLLDRLLLGATAALVVSLLGLHYVEEAQAADLLLERFNKMERQRNERSP